MSAKFISNLNINSTSSNIIIPMIPLKRPNSNFNIGGNILWEKIDNLNSKIINTEQVIIGDWGLGLIPKQFNNDSFKIFIF